MARRAALVYVFISIILIYLHRLKNIKVVTIGLTIVLLIGFCFCFGYLGNAKSGLDASYIPNNMGASDSFKTSLIPNEFYNTYLYICTPLANFQLTVDHGFYDSSGVDLVLQEYVPDFISNKLHSLFDIERSNREMQKVMEVLNVGTYFVGGMMYYGWIGVFLHCIYITVLAICIYLAYPNTNPYHVTINAFLCSLFLMAIFSNVFRIFINWLVFLIPIFPLLWDRVSKPKIKF